VLSLEAVAYSSYCNTVEWFWWDLSLSQWPAGFLLCFVTVGWVIWPVKIVPEVTYNVSSMMLSLHTLSQRRRVLLITLGVFNDFQQHLNDVLCHLHVSRFNFYSDCIGELELSNCVHCWLGHLD